MRLQTIKDNCERLIDFRKIVVPDETDWLNVSVPNAKELLKWYAILLDYCEAPIIGLSVLYVSADEFEEVEEFAKSVDNNYSIRSTLYAIEKNVPVEINDSPTFLLFTYLGYHWYIEKHEL